MNKLPIQVILLTSIIALLSSCSKQSSFSLTKRLYRSGYYVDFGSKGHTPKNATVATGNKKSTNQILPLETIKAGNLQIANASYLAPEKIAVAAKNTEAKKSTFSKNVIANYVSPEQNVFTPASTFHNTVSESITATQDEVRVYVVNVPFVIILLCAIFIPPLGVGLMYGLNIYFWVDLLLTLLFFIPGLIFALVVVLM